MAERKRRRKTGKKEEKCTIITKVEEGKEKTVQICDNVEIKDEKVSEKTKKKEEGQLKWILVITVAIVMVLVVGIWIYTESRNFEYAGLDFNKEMYGKILIYHAKIPVVNQNGEIYTYFNLYLRNDPRELKDIEVPSLIRINRNVIIAAGDDLGDCDDTGIAGVTLGQFVSIGRNVTTASTNQKYAVENNLKFTDCSFVDENTTVIITEKGIENKIINNNGCYIIQFRDCDILKSTERFMVGTYASYKGIVI